MAASAPHNGATDGLVSDLDERRIPPMGMTNEQFHAAAVSTINNIGRYYSDLSEQPVVPSVTAGYLQKLLPSQPPQDGESWQSIEQDLEQKLLPGMTHWQSPKFMAFFPASSTFPGILGEMWSAALTVPAFNWICSPVVTELETIVLDWLAQILGLPETFRSKGSGGGVINGSASETIVTVMIAARERFVRRQIEREGITDPQAIEDRSCEIRSKLVAMGSDQAHSSTQKGATIAGTRFRTLPTSIERDFALEASTLRNKIRELKSQGLEPFYLTVSLGTTSTCAIDNFTDIAEVLKEFPDVWVHCDAAYAGSALVLPEYQHLAQELAFVDSFNMNMHKWLLTNFDCSCLYVQKRRDLTDSFSITPAYLRNQFTESGLVTDYRDWQIALGRRFRALKVWFVIRTWGTDGLRRHIAHHIRLGNLFADLIRSRNDLFEILTPPRFALTVFKVRASQSSNLQHSNDATDSGNRKRDNEATKEVYTLINDQKDYYLTSSVVAQQYAIRVVSANPLAEEQYVRKMFQLLVSVTEQVHGQ